MSDAVVVTLDQGDVKELRALILDIHSNPFASGEIKALGGIRSVLSDELLGKLGFAVPQERDARLELLRINKRGEKKSEEPK